MNTQSPSYYRDLIHKLGDQSSQNSNEQAEQLFKKTAIKKFVYYALSQLNCQQRPKLVLSRNNSKVQEYKSFGHLNLQSGTIWVYVKNRNLADILRTVCHELVHFKQMMDGRLSGPEDGNDGSQIENEANSVAAVIMRQYGRSYPHIFE